jgi:hypothetical protein
MKGYAPGWRIRCRKCGFIAEAADYGSVRIGGASWKRFVLGRCKRCRRLTWLAFERSNTTSTNISTKPDPLSDLA